MAETTETTVDELWTYAGARSKAGPGDDILDCWIDPNGKELYFSAERRSPAIGGLYLFGVIRRTEDGTERVSRTGTVRWQRPGDHDQAQLSLWRAQDQKAREAKTARQAEDRLKREKPDWLTEEAKATIAKCRNHTELEVVLDAIQRAGYEIWRKGRS